MQSRYSNDYLMQALDFTSIDLASNREGMMTEAQKERFRERMGRGQTQAAIMVVIVLLISAGIIAFMVFSNAEEGSGLRQTLKENPTIIAAGLGGSFLLYLILVVYSFIRMRRMKSGNVPVKSISGMVRLSSSEMPYSTARAVSSLAGAQTRVCKIRIGRTTMYVDEDTFDAFEDGATYRIYYVGDKRAPMIVAAEVA